MTAKNMIKIGKKARFVIFAAILSLMSFLSYGRGIGVNAERFGGDAVAAEMVKAFLASDEYRNRFRP